jgi:hypothetical protein
LQIKPFLNIAAKRMKYPLLLIALLYFSCLGYAQQNFPLNRQFSLDFNDMRSAFYSFSPCAVIPDTAGLNAFVALRNSHPSEDASCFKPYIVPVQIPVKDKAHELLYRKLKKESLLIVRDSANRFSLSIDPLMDLSYGRDNAGSYAHPLTVNTRGFLIRGSIGTKFAFETSDYENQSWQPHYIDSFARNTQVIPGQGRWKQFKKGGFDYAMSSAYVSYSPCKHLNVQAGTGKHFVGDGYRSLLLSDNSFNYPYLRVTTNFGWLHYTNLYASFMNLRYSPTHIPQGTEHLYQKKSAAFQYLSLDLGTKIQIGIFQGLIAQGADSTNRQRLDFYYFNPVIGVAAVKYGFYDPNHVLMGSTIRIKVCSYFILYGQYMIDGISNSGSKIYQRNGFQAGAKFKNLLRIRNLYFQAEYNQVRPYSYASSDPGQSYTHYNQALGDPLGANFKESIFILNYRIKDFFVELKMNYALLGMDSTFTNYGQNVFASDISYTPGINPVNMPVLRGVKSTLMIYECKIGYLINPAYNLNLVAGIMIRDFKNTAIESKSNFIYFGIRTSLSNLYYDF